MRAREDNPEVTHKDVIVIGNGPSGLCMSYMLSGNIPYLISDVHPDELLSARLKSAVGKPLVHQNLRFLAEGLEGRSKNMISLLLDALIHPCADLGIEMQPLVEWRQDGKKIDHLVLGKGPPGGAWHSMDPQILTLSLGSWMSLPGLPYSSRDGSEKRAFAGNVAKYYEEYAQRMNLVENFKSNVSVTKVVPLKKTVPNNSSGSNSSKVTVEPFENDVAGKVDRDIKRTQKQECRWVRRVKEDVPEKRKLCLTPEMSDNFNKVRLCPLSNALNFIGCGRKKKLKGDRCYLQYKIKETIPQTVSVACSGIDDQEKTNSLQNGLTCDGRLCCSNPSNDRNLSSNFSCKYDFVNYYNPNDSISMEVPTSVISCLSNPDNAGSEDSEMKWLVEVYDSEKQKSTTFSCNNLILANGTSDIPNKLNLANGKAEPDWFVYTVRNLEISLDESFQNITNNPDPVLVIGAGLSAADAIIAARGRNVPVIHVFKANSEGLNKQLPENMYPEYHKVHQMMVDGGSSYPLYKALPGFTLSDFDSSKRTVVLTSNYGKSVTYTVSFAAILIGSKPDLSFLPEDLHLGIRKDLPVDCNTNPIDMNQLTHAVNSCNGLYVMGPLAGDNFVRFIPGGALAILADLYRKYGY